MCLLPRTHTQVLSLPWLRIVPHACSLGCSHRCVALSRTTGNPELPCNGGRKSPQFDGVAQRVVQHTRPVGGRAREHSWTSCVLCVVLTTTTTALYRPVILLSCQPVIASNFHSLITNSPSKKCAPQRNATVDALPQGDGPFLQHARTCLSAMPLSH